MPGEIAVDLSRVAKIKVDGLYFTEIGDGEPSDEVVADLERVKQQIIKEKLRILKSQFHTKNSKIPARRSDRMPAKRLDGGRVIRKGLR